jgi:hypothetical protein
MDKLKRRPMHGLPCSWHPPCGVVTRGVEADERIQKRDAVPPENVIRNSGRDQNGATSLRRDVGHVQATREKDADTNQESG